MNDNGVFVVGEHGSYRMLLSQKWYLEAKKRGLRDPWQHRPDKPLRTEEIISLIEGTEIKGTKTVYPDVDEETLSAWKVERDEYMRQRDEWTCLQMFHKYGYEIFLSECAIHSRTISEEFEKSISPCESKNVAQCTLFCPIYNNCAIREGDEEK